MITLKELQIQLEVNENGKDAQENARIKALAYYHKTGLTTISVDDSLWIEGLEEQPGNNVRRVNGKRLEDEEMIVHYANLIHQLGGNAKGYWVHGIAVCKEGNVVTYCKKSNCMFTEKISSKRTIGYPLDSISIVLEYGKYRCELNQTEKEDEQNRKNKELFYFIRNYI